VRQLGRLEAESGPAGRRGAAATGATYVNVNVNRISDGHDGRQPLGFRWVEPVLPGTNAVHPIALGESRMAAQAMKVLGPR
jgi:hypothetical protein